MDKDTIPTDTVTVENNVQILHIIIDLLNHITQTLDNIIDKLNQITNAQHKDSDQSPSY